MEPFEPPKYLASLTAAINDGAKSAQLGALAFTAIGLFLLATAFSATDEDLLLNHAISISQLGGAQVPVVIAFGLAPAVFLAAHLYTLIRYDMLAGNLRQFVADLPALVQVEANRERCRQLLANVEFVNALANPTSSRSASRLFRWIVVFLIAIFPVLVLLLVQISSLRMQNEVVNWVHHGCIITDMALLVWFFGRMGGEDAWSFRRSPPRRKLALCWLPALVVVADLLWLNIPGATSSTVGKDLLTFARYETWNDPPEPLLDRRTRVLLALPVQPVDLLLCPTIGWGCRFLQADHRLLVEKIWDSRALVELRGNKEVTPERLAGIGGVNLRGRTLRFADFTGSQLFAANLTEADLRGARLNGAQLKRAVLAGAWLHGAKLARASLEGADFSRASLHDANLDEAQLWQATFRSAQMPRASLSEAFAEGANFDEAILLDATMLSTHLAAASLLHTEMSGANLRRAALSGANLSYARLQGAELVDAVLDGAVLDHANFAGADLREASLWNCSLTDTEIGLADLRGTTANRSRYGEVDQLLPHLSASARDKLLHALEPRTNPPPGQPKMEQGPVLVDGTSAPTFANLAGDRTTRDVTAYDTKLAKYLARMWDEYDYGYYSAASDLVEFDRWSDSDRSLAALLNCELLAAAQHRDTHPARRRNWRLDEASAKCVPRP